MGKETKERKKARKEKRSRRSSPAPADVTSPPLADDFFLQPGAAAANSTQAEEGEAPLSPVSRILHEAASRSPFVTAPLTLHPDSADEEAVGAPVAAVSPSKRAPEADQYRVHPDHKNQKGETTTLRSGRTVPREWLTEETAQRWSQFKQQKPANRRCTICGHEARSDRVFKEHRKEHIWVVGCHCGYASRIRKNTSEHFGDRKKEVPKTDRCDANFYIVEHQRWDEWRTALGLPPAPFPGVRGPSGTVPRPTLDRQSSPSDSSSSSDSDSDGSGSEVGASSADDSDAQPTPAIQSTPVSGRQPPREGRDTPHEAPASARPSPAETAPLRTQPRRIAEPAPDRSDPTPSDRPIPTSSTPASQVVPQAARPSPITAPTPTPEEEQRRLRQAAIAVRARARAEEAFLRETGDQQVPVDRTSKNPPPHAANISTPACTVLVTAAPPTPASISARADEASMPPPAQPRSRGYRRDVRLVESDRSRSPRRHHHRRERDHQLEREERARREAVHRREERRRREVERQTARRLLGEARRLREEGTVLRQTLDAIALTLDTGRTTLRRMEDHAAQLTSYIDELAADEDRSDA